MIEWKEKIHIIVGNGADLLRIRFSEEGIHIEVRSQGKCRRWAFRVGVAGEAETVDGSGSEAPTGVGVGTGVCIGAGPAPGA